MACIWLYPNSISFTRIIKPFKGPQYIDVKSLCIQTYPTCYDTIKPLATKNAIAWSALVRPSDFCQVLPSALGHDSLPSFLNQHHGLRSCAASQMRELIKLICMYFCNLVIYFVSTEVVFTWNSSLTSSLLLHPNYNAASR